MFSGGFLVDLYDNLECNIDYTMLECDIVDALIDDECTMGKDFIGKYDDTITEYVIETMEIYLDELVYVDKQEVFSMLYDYAMKTIADYVDENIEFLAYQLGNGLY